MKIDKNDILEVMDQSDTVYLVTVKGPAPRIRAMVNLRRADICWPGGPSDPNCVDVRLTQKEAPGWSGSEPFYLDLRAL